MRLALALAFALSLTAGCAEEGGGFRFSRANEPLEPYFQEYHEVVAGEHLKRFDVPVDAPARLVNVTVQLDSRTNGLPVPGTPAAQLTARLLDPAGAVVREATLDTRTPVASLVAENAEPGLYALEVEGFGAAQDLDGETYGAGYVATIEVLYTE